MLAQTSSAYQQYGEKYSYNQTAKRLTILKHDHEHDWLNEVDATALQRAVRDLDSAYQGFFSKKKGFPKFMTIEMPSPLSIMAILSASKATVYDCPNWDGFGFPKSLFRLMAEGPEVGDLWIKYFKNGRMQFCPVNIIFDEYDESKLDNN
jgi:transposase